MHGLDKVWSYGLGASLLAVGGVALYQYREWNSMDPWYLALLLLGTAGMSFSVGWVLGYLTGTGLAPGADPGE